jgi:predicted PhzF superfamily epimerase YddE/YHI9
MEEPPFRYRAEQGCEIGRSGRIEVAIDPGDDGYVVRVGGRAVTLIAGSLSLPAR